MSIHDNEFIISQLQTPKENMELDIQFTIDELQANILGLKKLIPDSNDEYSMLLKKQQRLAIAVTSLMNVYEGF